MARRHSEPAAVLPKALRADLARAGYLPEVVTDIVEVAVGEDEVLAHFVHQETTFDEQAVRRHLTVLAVTEHRLVIAHADDHEGPQREHLATATTETVPLHQVRGVMLTHVLPDPESYGTATTTAGRAVTLTLGWGAVARVDLLPGLCEDPECEGDHGYEGTISGDDISLRVAADSEGPEALQQALDFSQVLSARLGR